MNKKQAIELIKKEGLGERIIKHSKKVNKIAKFIASEFNKNNVIVDLEIIDVASILHDIGRVRNHENHSVIGSNMLKEISEERIAKIIERHAILKIDELENWGKKLFFMLTKGRVMIRLFL